MEQVSLFFYCHYYSTIQQLNRNIWLVLKIFLAGRMPVPTRNQQA